MYNNIVLRLFYFRLSQNVFRKLRFYLEIDLYRITKRFTRIR